MGCGLANPAGPQLLNAGKWSHVDLGSPDEETPYEVMPHIGGVLTK